MSRKPIPGRWIGGLLAAIVALTTVLSVVGPPTGAPDTIYTPRIVSTPQPTSSSAPLTAGTVGDATWFPSVVFNDGVESASLEIPIAGGDFDSIWLTAEGVLRPDPDIPAAVKLLADDLIRLYDDGTHGDRNAADGVFSRGDITATGTLSHDGGTHQRLANTVLFFEETGGGVRSISLTLDTGLAVVDVSQRGTIAVTSLEPNLSRTSHALFLVDDGTVFPGYPNVDAQSAVNVCLACEIVIDRFGDNFDFIILQTREVVNETGPEDRQAFFSNITNSDQGIGIEERDLNIGPGTFFSGEPFNTFSSGRLQGIIFDNRIDGAPLSHEIMHRWGVEAAPSLNWLDGAGHYGSASDINGIMDNIMLNQFGSQLRRDDTTVNPVDIVWNGDGTFRLVERIGEFAGTFAPISLYLAGFIPAAQVPTMRIVGTLNVADPDAVITSSVREVRVDDVIAVEGPRVPSSLTAPRDFTVGTIVIGDRPYAEAETTFITLALRYWESDKAYDGFGTPPWKSATLGQSSLTVQLPGDVALPPPPPPPPLPPGDTVTTTLTSGWNLVGFGATQSVTDATAGIAGRFSAIFTWDSSAQRFLSFSASLPAALNSLQQIQAGDGVWLLITAPGGTEWVQPSFTTARDVALDRGFNLVTWSGPSGASVAQAVAGLGNALDILFTWDPASQTFRSFNPTAPSFLNSADTFQHGEGVWMQINRATTWSQPAP